MIVPLLLQVGIFGLLILVLDFALSIWNAYASGFNIGLLRKSGQGGFSEAASYAGLGLAFVGMAYVLIVVLSFIAYAISYVDISTLQIALGFNFLVLGFLIIGFGLMVTIQSIIIAIQRKNFWSIFAALYNVTVEILDIASYTQGFGESVQMITGGNREEKGNAIIIIVIALLSAFFIVHAAYKHGYNKATGG